MRAAKMPEIPEPKVWEAKMKKMDNCLIQVRDGIAHRAHCACFRVTC